MNFFFRLLRVCDPNQVDDIKREDGFNQIFIEGSEDGLVNLNFAELTEEEETALAFRENCGNSRFS